MKDNREELKNKDAQETEKLSLNDDRRVKVLSPGALVAKRFFPEPSGSGGAFHAHCHVPVLLCGRNHQPL